MKVLVTGGQGFIGGHVVSALAKAGHTPLVLGRRDFGPLGPSGGFVLADIRDYESVSEAISKVDRVIHLAALVGTERSIRMPEAFIETNVLGAINVFDACRFFGKPCVYASVGNGDDPNLYAISKSTAARLAQMYNKEHGTRIIVARVFNAYGEGQRLGAEGRLIPTALDAALRNRPINVFGTGQKSDDFVYVGDVARLLVKAIENDALDPLKAWDIGTGVRSSVAEVVDMIRSLTGSSSEIAYVGHDRAGEGKRQAAADPACFIDPDYAFTPLEDGIRAVIAAGTQASGSNSYNRAVA
jgi:UDP-glucose 4-epimerase